LSGGLYEVLLETEAVWRGGLTLSIDCVPCRFCYRLYRFSPGLLSGWLEGKVRRCLARKQQVHWQFKIYGLLDSAVQHCGLATSSNMAATFAHVFLHQVVCLFVFVVLLLVALVNCIWPASRMECCDEIQCAESDKA
jgi:hypothetical protein